VNPYWHGSIKGRQIDGFEHCSSIDYLWLFGSTVVGGDPISIIQCLLGKPWLGMLRCSEVFLQMGEDVKCLAMGHQYIPAWNISSILSHSTSMIRQTPMGQFQRPHLVGMVGEFLGIIWDYTTQYIGGDQTLLCESQVGMDQYLLIPFLGEWTSIYQLFWCSPGVQGFDTLPGSKPVWRCSDECLKNIWEVFKTTVGWWFFHMELILPNILVIVTIHVGHPIKKAM